MKKTGFCRYENGVMAMLGLTFGLVFFDRMAVTYLLPFIIKDIPLTGTQIGLLSASLALTWAISGYLAGAHSDRSGRRKEILVLTVFGFAVCTILSGFATSVMTLLIIRAIMGLVEGPVLPIAQSIMAEESSNERRGFNMGVLQNVAFSLLALMAGPPVMIAFASFFGWRTSLYIVGIPGLLMALVLWRYLRSHKRTVTSTAYQPLKNRMSLSALLRYRNISLCLLIACGLVSCVMIMMTFTPLFLVNTKALTPGQMGEVMAMFGLGSFVWGFVVPMLSDRFGRKYVIAFFSLIMTIPPLAIAHFNGSFSILALLVFLTFVGPGCIPLAMAIVPSETIPPNMVGTALGLIMGVSEVVGGVIATTAAGLASDAFGAQLPFYISAAGAFGALVLSLFLIETAPSKVGLKVRPNPASI